MFLRAGRLNFRHFGGCILMVFKRKFFHGLPMFRIAIILVSTFIVSRMVSTSASPVLILHITVLTS